MKINQIIRQRRRELSLTQEQVAAYLGVSTPAVNKWEKGSTYPDITLLPALARLRTDLNTLLSFQEDLSDVEIETFVDHLDQMVQEQGTKPPSRPPGARSRNTPRARPCCTPPRSIWRAPCPCTQSNSPRSTRPP